MEYIGLLTKLSLNKRWIRLISEELFMMFYVVTFIAQKANTIQDRIKSDLIASKWLLLDIITIIINNIIIDIIYCVKGLNPGVISKEG